MSVNNILTRRSSRKMEGADDGFSDKSSNQEFYGIDWNILPGLTSLEMLRKIQNDLQSRNIDPEN